MLLVYIIRLIYKKAQIKIDRAIESGDVYRANEISANIMLDGIMSAMTALLIIALILNEISVFTIETNVMRLIVFGVLLIELPVKGLTHAYHGEPRWVKYLLEGAITLICASIYAVLGHNVTLILVTPVLLSIRYSNVNFTRKIILMNVITFALANVVKAYWGILDLNFYPIPAGEVIVLENGKFHKEVIEGILDKGRYLEYLFLYSFLPKLLGLSLVGFASVQIASHGRRTVELQDEISSKNSRIETELSLASQIQSGMLPEDFPDDGTIELYAYNAPAREVSGDFYDYFRIDGDRTAFLLADVTGKGIGAALFMAVSKAVIKNQLLTNRSPAQALMNSNEQLCENNKSDLFVTLWVGVYEASTGTLTYVNAGHNPPVLISRGRPCEFLRVRNGFVLAGMEGSRYTQGQLQLSPGDEIFLYTDGLTEANNARKELFGEQRLLEQLEAVRAKPVRDQIEDMIGVVKSYCEDEEQLDDITLMGVRIRENGEEKPF